MKQELLLGDEAVAMAAIHAGITAAYSYPGTPATEILETILAYSQRHQQVPKAFWCANEKTALEAALGTSLVNGRSLVSMKHVGLNVAADPFINSALIDLCGGLVLAVADDPGMHSSQNEQDSRYYADLARTLCLEPSSPQEAYQMTREAFLLSERWHLPVLVRLVTRLSHGRSAVCFTSAEEPNPIRKTEGSAWTLIPAIARRQWRKLLQLQTDLYQWSEQSPFHRLYHQDPCGDFGVITCGLALNHYQENVGELEKLPNHLHLGAYPPPMQKIRDFLRPLQRVLVLEEGYPFLEQRLRGIVPIPLQIEGKLSGHVPPDGELNPDLVRRALRLPDRKTVAAIPLPGRPPQLCTGCPHGDTYSALKIALAEFPATTVTSDIGCYTLGALPPYSAIESCVCMGASIGMAKGAADAGFFPCIAVIGDSTFLHSGITPLLDAVACNANMTLLILDNEAIAMTGGQPPLLPSSRLEKIVLGLGVDPDHCKTISALPRETEKNASIIRSEIHHDGLSVIIALRECLETAKKKKKSLS